MQSPVRDTTTSSAGSGPTIHKETTLKGTNLNRQVFYCIGGVLELSDCTFYMSQ